MKFVGPYGRWSYGPTNLEIVHTTLLVESGPLRAVHLSRQTASRPACRGVASLSLRSLKRVRSCLSSCVDSNATRQIVSCVVREGGGEREGKGGAGREGEREEGREDGHERTADRHERHELT